MRNHHGPGPDKTYQSAKTGGNSGTYLRQSHLHGHAHPKQASCSHRNGCTLNIEGAYNNKDNYQPHDEQQQGPSTRCYSVGRLLFIESLNYITVIVINNFALNFKRRG